MKHMMYKSDIVPPKTHAKPFNGFGSFQAIGLCTPLILKSEPRGHHDYQIDHPRGLHGERKTKVPEREYPLLTGISARVEGTI